MDLEPRKFHLKSQVISSRMQLNNIQDAAHFELYSGDDLLLQTKQPTLASNLFQNSSLYEPGTPGVPWNPRPGIRQILSPHALILNLKPYTSHRFPCEEF